MRKLNKFEKYQNLHNIKLEQLKECTDIVVISLNLLAH